VKSFVGRKLFDTTTSTTCMVAVSVGSRRSASGAIGRSGSFGSPVAETGKLRSMNPVLSGR
jgi:hypothetical protein